MSYYRNIGFCLKNCANMDCERNKAHLDNRPEDLVMMPIKFYKVCNCEKYIKPKEADTDDHTKDYRCP